MMNKKTFILADDDADDTEMFCEALTIIDSSIICHCAVDGRDAISLVDKLPVRPDLIFLDVNMPVMNGWECLQLLKGDERLQHIPVIIISTSSHKREVEIAGSLGALCYLTKPNDFNELTELLQLIASNTGAGLLKSLQQAEQGGSKYIHCFSRQQIEQAGGDPGKKA
ncbi:MAG TPA: response regulator [Flavitalea sp.]|nr:response regulator [Flavitalea sp.]